MFVSRKLSKSCGWLGGLPVLLSLCVWTATQAAAQGDLTLPGVFSKGKVVFKPTVLDITEDESSLYVQESTKVTWNDEPGCGMGWTEAGRVGDVQYLWMNTDTVYDNYPRPSFAILEYLSKNKGELPRSKLSDEDLLKRGCVVEGSGGKEAVRVLVDDKLNLYVLQNGGKPRLVDEVQRFEKSFFFRTTKYYLKFAEFLASARYSLPLYADKTLVPSQSSRTSPRAARRLRTNREKYRSDLRTNSRGENYRSGLRSTDSFGNASNDFNDSMLPSVSAFDV